MDAVERRLREILARYPRLEFVGRLEGDTPISQYGNNVRPTERGTQFREVPLPNQPGVSVIRGHLDPIEAARSVRGSGVKQVVGPHGKMYLGAGVRHTTVERLDGEGFFVFHTKTSGNPEHCTVMVDGVWADPDHVDAFNACFAPAVWDQP